MPLTAFSKRAEPVNRRAIFELFQYFLYAEYVMLSLTFLGTVYGLAYGFVVSSSKIKVDLPAYAKAWLGMPELSISSHTICTNFSEYQVCNICLWSCKVA